MFFLDNPVIFVLTAIETVLFWGVAIAAIVGAVMAANTREDAFTAGDRQSKMTWVAIMAGSALALLLNLPFLKWIAVVCVGVYWFDVRPQLRALINGDYRY